MGIKSTHSVTREFATLVILKKVANGEMTDEQLEDLLETAIHNGFYNFSIVSKEELEEEKNGRFGSFYLDDLDNLPEYNDVY